MDLETLKGEIELDAERDTDEQDKLYKELVSVEASLKRLSNKNGQLQKQIGEETT